MRYTKYLSFIHVWILNLCLNLYPFFVIDPFFDNQSHIGNQMGHPIYLILWAISSAWGFYYLSKVIWDKTNFPYPGFFHTLICILMVLSCIIPYSLDQSSWINDLHIWMAIASVTCFIMEWLYYFYWKGNLDRYERFLLFVFMFCAFLLLFPGHITSSAETAFSCLVNMVLYILAFLHKRDTIKP